MIPVLDDTSIGKFLAQKLFFCDFSELFRKSFIKPKVMYYRPRILSLHVCVGSCLHTCSNKFKGRQQNIVLISEKISHSFTP